MTRIDFYLLQNPEPDGKKQLICKLADKAYRLGHQVYILTTSEEEARQLDDLLWVFNPGSFVPHGLLGEPDKVRLTALPPILIGHQESPDTRYNVLISLWREVPGFFSRFERLVELVGHEEEEKQRARAKFRFYRDRGYPLETHNM
ncbi:MAG TPA: DNA polymerase III subunit chi [Acidiferrobacterales bacterium]|nr:DNA polymerase III subunit chi [Acidiferrobacterales bacterium]